MSERGFTEMTNQGKWDGKNVDLQKPQYVMEALKMSAAYAGIRVARSNDMKLPTTKSVLNVGVSNFFYEWAVEATERGGNRFMNFPKVQQLVKFEDETATEGMLMVNKWLYMLAIKFLLSRVTPGASETLGADAYNIALAIILRHGVGWFATSEVGDAGKPTDPPPPNGFEPSKVVS